MIALAATVALLSSAWAQAPPAPVPTPLSEGDFVARDMTAGEAHAYAIDLRQGDYLQIDIEQQGIDVAVEVTGPQAEPVLSTDSHGGEGGPEPVAFVAAASGTYRLLLSGGPRPWPPSHYELRVVAVRPPTERDLMRVATVATSAESLRLMKGGAEGRGDEVLALLERELKGWEALGERYLQSSTESQIGWVKSNFLDRFDQAYDHYVRALEIAREVRNEYGEAFMSSNVAAAAVKLGRLQEALSGGERALELERASGRRGRLAVSLTASGGMLVSAGRPQAALDRLEEALGIFADVPYPLIEGYAHLYTGNAYIALGEYDLAIEAFRRANARFTRAVRLQALVERQTGFAHINRGNAEQAAAAYDRALAAYAKLGKRSEEAATSVLMAVVQRGRGDLPAALERLKAALPALETAGDRDWEVRGRCELAETLRRLGKQAEAREALGRVVDSPPTPEATLCVELVAARLARDAGDLKLARSHAGQAVDAVESLRTASTSPRWRASTLAAHHEVFALAVDTEMRLHDREPTAGHAAAALEMSERARARVLLDLLSESGVDVREGVAPDLRAEERALRQRLNLQAVALDDAVAAGSVSRADLIRQEVEKVAVRLAEVEGRIRLASPAYAALSQPQPLTVSAIRDSVLDGETQLVEYALGDEQSHAWVLSPHGLQSFRLASRHTIESAARRFSAAAAAPDGGRGEVERVEAAAELSRLVVAPLAGALTARRLLLVAPGALEYVPFALLPLTDGRLLLERFELVATPSASVIATLRAAAAGTTEPPKTVAVFADPVFEEADPRLAAPVDRAAVKAAASALPAHGDALGRAFRDGQTLRRLPFSLREAKAITGLTVPARSRQALGFEASRESALAADLAQYRVVHFATHGVLNSARPELSGVVLSLYDRAGRRQDGFLRLHDVYNMRLNADLVVLSGCQTALGREVRGEGLIGLTRGFMYAGAKAVVASLWQVDDESTSELMKRFYRGMLKENRRPADALRAAQLDMSRHKRWSAPFYWAGFVLQGEWR